MHIHTRTPAYTYIRAQRYINIREFLSHGLWITMTLSSRAVHATVTGSADE